MDRQKILPMAKAVLVLAAIALAFTLLTILRLKRVYRQKD